MKHVVLWDDGNDKDFSQVCPDDELDLFLKELPDLYNGAKNVRVYALTEAALRGSDFE